MTEVQVCRSSDIADEGTLIVHLDDLEVGVVRHRGTCFAYRNTCPHQGGPVCEGVRMPKVIPIWGPDRSFVRSDFDPSEVHLVCPWHSYEFNIETGVHAGDTAVRLQKFPVSERDGLIFVTI